jgi:hypothetical protein
MFTYVIVVVDDKILFIIYSYSKSNQMYQLLKFILFWNNTLQFWTVFPSIIRSSRLHTATGICQTGTAFCLLASRQQYLLLYAQSRTSEDGQKDHLKHVECYSKTK